MRRLIQNAALLSIADAAQKGATGVLALLVARYLGPEQYGKYATAAAVSGLFLMITGLGFEQEFTRRAGMDQSRLAASLKLTMRAVGSTSVVSVVALGIFLLFGVYSPEISWLTLFMMGALLLARFHLPFRHLCLVTHRSHVNAGVQIVSTASLVGLTLLVFAWDGSLEQIIGAQALTAAAVTAVWFAWARRRVPRAPPVEPGDLRDFFKKALPFALSNLLWIAYFNFGTFLLSLMTNEAEVGLYAGAYKVIAINYIFGYAIANSFTPSMFSTAHRHPLEYRKSARHMMVFLALVSGPLAAVLYFGSDFIMTVVMGPGFELAGDMARILAISVFFRMMNFGLAEILTTSGRQRMRLYLEAALLILNVGLGLVLIPRYGGNGAAVAMVAVEILYFTAGLIAWQRVRSAR